MLFRSQFQVSHASDQHVSDEYYLASWAVAYYLTFDRKKLGTAQMDEYVASLRNGTNPIAAFRTLVDEPLGQFEGHLKRYFRDLHGDGTTERLVPGKEPEPSGHR